MIRPLRQRHRVMVCTLGVLVPMAFVAGIAVRRSVPVVTFSRIRGIRSSGGIPVRAEAWPLAPSRRSECVGPSSW